jgi:malate dehydrogenase
MKKIAIIGCGNFGANAACFIAENRLGNVILVDNKEGLAKGKALDLMEAAPVRGFDVQVDGADDLSAIAGAAVVVFAAGVSPTAEVSTEILLAENLKVMDEVLPQVKKFAPEAVLVIQREPVAALVAKAVKQYGFSPAKVIGVTGLIESARFRFLMASALGASDQDTSAMVIGGAGEQAIPLTQYANLSGIPASEVLSAAQIEQVVAGTRKAEGEVLAKLRRTPAYYAPAAALSELIAALARDKKRYLPVTVMAQGQYGLKDVAVTLPVLVGAAGVEKIQELALTDGQQAALKDAAGKNAALVA